MERALHWLARIESAAAAIAYVIVAGLLLGEIVARELLSTTIWGSQKIAVFAAIYAGFLGLSLATASNAHLRPQFADNWPPAAIRGWFPRIGDGLSAVLFLALGIIATLYLMDTYANQDRAAVLYWPLWPFQAVIAYAFYSSSVRHLAFMLRPDLKPAPDVVEG